MRKSKIIYLLIIILLLTSCKNLQKNNEIIKRYSNKYFEFNYPSSVNVVNVGEDKIFVKFINNKTSNIFVSIKNKKIDSIDKILKEDKKTEKEEEQNVRLRIKKKIFKKIKIDNVVGDRIEVTDAFLNYNEKQIKLNLYKSNKEFNFVFSNLSLNKHKEEKIFNKILKSIKFKDFKDIKIKKKKIKSKKTLTSKEAIEDAKYMVNKLRIHPDLYYSISKNEFNKKYKALIKKIESKEKISKKELFILFSEFIAKIKDGHTNLEWNKSGYKKDIRNFPLFRNGFPILVNIRDNKILINKKNSSKIGEMVGGEIISINGVSADKILKRMKKLIASDPNSKKWVEVRIQDGFPMWYSLIYNGSKKYTVKYIKSNSKGIKKVVLRGGISERESWKNNNYGKNIELSYLKKDIAIIRINKFPFENSDGIVNFIGNMKSYFNEMKDKKIKYLIIDDRFNLGGSPELADYFYRNLEKNNKNYYKGKVYLLVGRRTFSAGVTFSNYVRLKDKKIKIIGNKTGGWIECYGNGAVVILPNSNFRINIPIISYKVLKNIKRKGNLIPDIKVDIAPEKEALGKDQVMDKVLELIKNR
ncbi:S41 family peptidase [Haliovirga abyssi]|uniref:Tail specific protease domain-containing protein n=1 Tax=Haliovirga abyssi TaxID=2996794 RepID=A0AAU9E062_9FUSO|nr:S41 family peptidase [Haliovirga abyssi]BDU51260.1 hypothetical protein HLVA_18290 [Haliovirga abyssi]